MAIKKTRSNAGETLVEVMASMFLFLIMMGILEGAISYSNASLVKNKEIRANNTAVLENLTQTPVEDVEIKDISFKAVNSDLTVLGKQVFTVRTKLQKKVVEYKDTDLRDQTVTFNLYSSTVENSTDPDQPDASGGDGS